jgi:signal transduction histidine kinase
LYWKDVNRQGAVLGLTAGFLVWGYTLVVPTLIQVGFLPEEWLSEGPFGLVWFNPQNLLGSGITNPIVHGTFWSLFFNISALSLGVVFGEQSAKEKNLAEFYIHPFSHGSEFGERLVWKGRLVYKDLIQVSQQLLGKGKVDKAVRYYEKHYETPIEKTGEVKPAFVSYVERMLSGAVGATSARMLISSIAKEDEIVLSDVIEIIRQKKETTLLNERLRYKSNELEQKTTQLEIANKRLQNLDQEKDEFISTVNHELRTPLTSIRALCEIIHDHEDMEEAERKEFLTTIITEAERMTRLINQVLDLEKLESGRMRLQKERVELKAFLEDVLFPYEKLCKEKSLNLIHEFVDERLELEIDKDKITEVIVNLTANAIKHTEQGYIKVCAERQNTHALVSIIDTGKGIEYEDLDRIFDKFYQVKGGQDRKPGGSGLGLPIAKKLVNLHDGHIWVKSQPNIGSEFSFTIPLSNN